VGVGGVRYRIGLWTAGEEEESLNFKELKNLVDTVKEEAEAGPTTPRRRVVPIIGCQSQDNCTDLS
jgi:hypothetical protein